MLISRTVSCPVFMAVALLVSVTSVFFAPAARAASVWTHRSIAQDGQAGIEDIESADINDSGAIAVLALRTVDVASVTNLDTRRAILRLEGDVLVPVVLPGTVLPGGLGTLVSIGSSDFSIDGSGMAIDGAGRIIFRALVRDGTLAPSPSLHVFRWEGGTTIRHLTEVPLQGLNSQRDGHHIQHLTADGRWLVTHDTGSFDLPETRYLFTDGTTSTEIARANLDLTEAGDCFMRVLDVVGLSPVGQLIAYEETFQSHKAPNDPNCGSGGLSTNTSSIKRFTAGQAEETLVSGTSTAVVGVSEAVGQRVFGGVVNARGDVAFVRDDLVGAARAKLIRHDAQGDTILLAAEQLNGPDVSDLHRVHDLDEEGRLVWKGRIEADVGETLYAGVAPAIDRVIGARDIVFGVEVGSTALLGVAHLTGSFADRRQLLIQYHQRDGIKSGLLVASREGVRWNNAAGGAWDVATNWTPQKVPGSAEAVIFDQEASYDVAVGTRTAGRALVENGSVGFQSIDLTLTGPLLVGGDATLTMPGGSLHVGELTVGHLPPLNPASEPTARFNASDTTLSLVVSGPAIVGQAGKGEMSVTQGIVLTGDLSIGAGSEGIVNIGMDGTEWRTTGGIAVGMTHAATLNIERGAAVQSGGDMVIGLGKTPPGGGGGGPEAASFARAFDAGVATQPLGLVVIDNTGATTTALALGNLVVHNMTIGARMPGRLEIRAGGVAATLDEIIGLQTALFADAQVDTEARIDIVGTGAAADQSSALVVSGPALLGMAAQTATVVAVEDGGFFSASGPVSLAREPGSEVSVLVSGVGPRGERSTLNWFAVDGNGTEAVDVGRRGTAQMAILGGALVEVRGMFISRESGSRGTVHVGGRSGSVVSALRSTKVSADSSTSGFIMVGGTPLAGGEDGSLGTLELNGGEVSAALFAIARGGEVLGNGTITVTNSGLCRLGGVMEPSVNVVASLGNPGRRETGVMRAMSSRSAAARDGESAATALSGPATITIHGNVVLESTGVIKLDLPGASAADRIVVDGALTLGGALQLNFSNGYAPRAGDILDLITSTSATGAFATTTITGLQPGFQFTLAPNGAGGVRLTAVNDAVASTAVGSRLANLSVRTPLADGQNLIVGFVVQGGAKPVLVRAAGPGLAQFLAGSHPDPRITLFDGAGVSVDANDNWPSSLAPTMSFLGAFPFASASADAALQNNAGAAYTAHVNGPGSGIVLVELYDAQAGVTPRLVNASARNRVGTGDAVLIAGFVVEGTTPKTLLVRGVGPALAGFNVTGFLADPHLALFGASGPVLAQNDDWASTLAPTFAAVGAFGLTSGSKDAALLVTLAPGIYTAQVSGVGGTTGEALVEIYEVP